MFSMSGGLFRNLPTISDASTSPKDTYQGLPQTGPWILYPTRRSHDPTKFPWLDRPRKSLLSIFTRPLLYDADAQFVNRTWRVSVGDGLFGRRMTTIAALEALSKLEAQLMRYGPASVSFVVGTGSWAFYGRGGITFEKLQGDSTTKFVASEKL